MNCANSTESTQTPRPSKKEKRTNMLLKTSEKKKSLPYVSYSACFIYLFLDVMKFFFPLLSSGVISGSNLLPLSEKPLTRLTLEYSDSKTL